jgi:hypothetical protein
MYKDIFDNPLAPGDLIIHSAGRGLLAYSVVREICDDKLKIAYPVEIVDGLYRIRKSSLRSAQVVKMPIDAMQNWQFTELANEYRNLQERISNGDRSF